ncbi:hypothetical protein BD413DRAFT_545777 [Trametes elegans]|nr:hypothetical protein BD413DRAFT_545777 [Trametes elegans]
MPTFAELRAKAAKATDAGVSKLSNTRERMTSQPSKKIDWNAEIKPKPAPPPPPVYRPPPPPSRTGSRTDSSASGVSGKSLAPPVPLRKTGSPAATSLTRSASTTSQESLAPPVPLRKTSPSAAPSLARSSSAASQASSVSPTPPPRPPPRLVNSQASSLSPSPAPSTSSLPAGPPPPIRRETRPDHASAPSQDNLRPPPPVRRQHRDEADVDRIDWANLSSEDKQVFFSWLDEFFSRHLGVPIPPRSTAGTVSHIKAPAGGHVPSVRPDTASDSITSYPPRAEHGSLAEDLAHYFSPSTHWPSAWYTSDTDLLAPPLKGNSKLAWTASWSSDGRTKTLFAGVLFCDLSMCFYSRAARFLPRPAPWDRARLLDAHETYGETVAGFAESFEGTGRACARGECWDLANEALRSFEQYDWVPKPVPSIARTHGHLLYEGRAADKARTQRGRWRGGDDRVRRGDIVEWRQARVGQGRNGWSVLGDPDHTAVIVSEMTPRATVADGLEVPPRDLGTLEVIEQSLGKPPARATYDLSNLEEGEVWIYRPVGMEAYVGSLLVPQCPEGVHAQSV